MDAITPWSHAEFKAVKEAADHARRRYEDHDPNTFQHSVRVANWSVLIATKIASFALGRLQRLEITGLLHDYGKVFLDPGVVRKAGPLSPDEWLEMKRHPELGVQNLPVEPSAVEPGGIHWHHKRFDGSGYPAGEIRGLALPLEARIIAVADVFDALTSVRPYRLDKPSYTPEEALDLMRENSGHMLDPSLVSLFCMVYSQECYRAGGKVGTRTFQVRSVIGVEIDRARQALLGIIGPHEPSTPLRGRRNHDEILGRLVAALLRSNLDLRSAENVGRYVLRMPLHDTFAKADFLDAPVAALDAPGRHHVEVLLRLARLPQNVPYMGIVVYKGELWISVGERTKDAIEITLAR